MARSISFYGVLSVCVLIVLVSAAGLQASVTYSGSMSPTPGAEPFKYWDSSTSAYVGTTLGEGLIGSISVDGGGTSIHTHLLSLGHGDVGANGTVTLKDSGTSWTVDYYTAVGADGHGTFTVQNGAVVNSMITNVGWQSNSNGYLTVDGATWKNGRTTHISDLVVGYSGTGTLDVTNGGLIENVNSTIIGYNSGSFGNAMVTNGSYYDNGDYMYVGYSADSYGMLQISGGSIVDTGSGMTIGWSSNSEGIVELSNGQLNVNDTLCVGGNGKGTLNITQGSSVTNNYAYIGNHSMSASDIGTGSVTVSGAGSSWTNNGHLYVGSYGKGDLTVTDGATVSSGRSYIGYSGDYSEGMVTVKNGGQWTVDGDLYVGKDGSGVLEIGRDGLVEVIGELFIDYDRNSDSFISIHSGGMLKMNLWGEEPGSVENLLMMLGGYDAVRFWGESTGEWISLSNATYGEDYTWTTDAEDMFILTVTQVPEPTSLALLALGAMTLIRRR